MQAKYSDKYSLEHSMIGYLGIELISEEEGLVKAKMPVNEKTSQPFGVLCGGASLAFAEIIAGYGSFLYCGENEIPVGSSVSGNHISSVKTGDGVWVYAVAKCLYHGRRTHIWNVDIFNKDEKLISTVRVTNFIVEDKSKSWK
mgnify:FL=1